MTKELFIKRMSLIQNFLSKQETISKFIQTFSDGHCVINIGDELIDAMIELINENLHIEDKELLSWWLWEDVDKVMYEGTYGEKSISVKTLEELYEYIVDTN